MRLRMPGYSVTRVLLAFVVLGALWLGCSDQEAKTPPDTQAPEVRILYPVSTPDNPHVVNDSTDVYIGAMDARAVQVVELYYSRPQDEERRLVGATTTAIDLSSVPDEIQDDIHLPDGWSLYVLEWKTQTIASGLLPLAFARALDPSGNTGVSEPLVVKVLNLGQPLHPPFFSFVPLPERSAVTEPIQFDPRGGVAGDPGVLTYDDIDPLAQISIRWDFDGDAVLNDFETERGWDIKFRPGPGEPNATALDVVSHQYSSVGQYLVQAQARNTYLSDVTTTQKTVLLTTTGGLPTPPQPGNYAPLTQRVVFHMGSDSASVLSGAADGDEAPRWLAELPGHVFIEKTEVTNELYLAYLQEAAGGGSPTVRLSGTNILSLPDSRILAELPLSRIFYDVDAETFSIERGYEQHPVTGVTWYGADAYCQRYNLRLPYEAEWEFAARGDSAAWAYPWGRTIGAGDVVDGSGAHRANFGKSGDPFESTNPVRYFNGETHGDFVTVDSPSAFGLYDMCGNVAEWIADWYGPYEKRYERTPNGNPVGPTTGILRVIRGGSFRSTARDVRSTNRSGTSQLERGFETVGFRTAYTDYTSQ